MKRSFFSLLICVLVFSMLSFSEEKSPPVKYGKVTLEEMLADSPDWADKAETYAPDSAMTDYLAGVPIPIEIVVYFGHWCGDSKNNIPRFIKIMHVIDNDMFSVEYWSVPRVKKGEKRGPVNGRELKRIPTFVIYLNGKEIGEIVENPRITIETDLRDIIQKFYTEE